MNARGVVAGGVTLGVGVCVAWFYWPSEPGGSTTSLPSSSKPAHSSRPPDEPLPPPSVVESPSVAPPSSAEPKSDAGAATLAQRLESNRLLKDAREAEGSRQFELYDDALKANPNNLEALMELGELRLGNEDYEDAEALAKRCLKLDKDRLRCQQTLERRFTRTGDFESAAKLYVGCLEAAQVKAGCLSFQAGAALRDGNLPRAKELHARLVALQPKSIDSIVIEAGIARESGDGAGARAAYQRGCDRGNEFACTWLSKHPE